MNERLLGDLLDICVEGDLEEPQRLLLNQQLRGDRAAQQVYLEYLALHAALNWNAVDRERSLRCEPFSAAAPAPRSGTARLTASDSVASEAPAIGSVSAERPPVSPVLGFLGNVWDQVQSSPRTLVMILGGVLAVYFVTVFALIPLARWAGSTRLARNMPAAESPAQPAPVGTLAAGAKARWADDLPPPRGTRVRPGEQYKLALGRVELSLSGGTQVVIDGPAVWKLESDQRLMFSVGKLTAYVPQAAIGFTVATPSAEVIDLGTEFGVEVDASGQADVHVLKGQVAVKPTTGAQAVAARNVRLSAGSAIRVRAGQNGTLPIPFEGPRFEVVEMTHAQSPAVKSRLRAERPQSGEIWLSNLFDDPPGTSLAEAQRTDTFKATPEVGGLGIHCAVYGGDPAVTIAPRVTLDLKNLGWMSTVAPHRIANDAWTHSNGFGAAGGLRLSGTAMSLNEPRLEDGIGMHADALVTFDLDEIRAAGNLRDEPLAFVCDQAGVNDTAMQEKQWASLHVLALVSTRAGIRYGLLDGKAVEVTEREGLWSVTSVIGAPLRAGGPFPSFRMVLTPEDKYLTLAAASAGDSIQLDHAVWLGARLVVIRQPE